MMEKYPSLNSVELFSGSGEVSNQLSLRGFNTFKIDMRSRKGICIPDLRIDVKKCTPALIPYSEVHVLWASVPCKGFSYGAGNYYFDKNSVPKKSAQLFIRLLEKSLELIEQLSPVLYFIENPRGHMRYQKSMIDFLSRTNGTIKTLTLSSYGFPTTKPTNLFTNAFDYSPKSMAPFGRGNKNPASGILFENMTECARQKTPPLLASEVAEYCYQKLTGTLQYQPQPLLKTA